MATLTPSIILIHQIKISIRQRLAKALKISSDIKKKITKIIVKMIKTIEFSPIEIIKIEYNKLRIIPIKVINETRIIPLIKLTVKRVKINLKNSLKLCLIKFQLFTKESLIVRFDKIK